ncbi:type IV pili methyl-accepting chemotaxis transducer N-terminal domain-containing protein [bacterium]|nr:type IV pili methyl-accepting chemotaxis transducer N-terminal domain-containing protein [bacterium]MBU1990780.1 type IV pili methyl-accepting chemotaxis transducer N-terminal domain-containing protein [bacterium]
MKINKISTKIKVLGLLLIFLMLSVISTTIYLNQQNAKDALIINMVGKQRMLTQKMAKNIFYIYYSSNKDFYELNSAIDEFIATLNILKHGDKEKQIASVPTQKIADQLSEVNVLWEKFYEDIQNYKLYATTHEINSTNELKRIVDSIYKNNTILLDNVDKLVTLYTNNSETKTDYIRTFQYSSAAILFIIFLYSLFQLRVIESHVDEFMQYSKKLANDNENTDKLKPIQIEAESELLEVSDTINCFIKKINSAMDYSNEALLQSQQAAQKLEELTDEFDNILDELKDKQLTHKHLNNSEDIVIESTEELINSTKKLQNLKNELEKLTRSCQEAKL